MSKQIAIEKLRAALQKIGEEYHLHFVVVFGSYAKGNASAQSDVDIAVVEGDHLSSDRRFALLGEISSLSEATLARNADILFLTNSDPLLRYHIARDGILLYGSLHDYAEYRARAFSAYMDHQALFALERALNRKLQKRLEHIAHA